MASVVEICNQALSHIRAGSINSLDEDSIQAQRCKLFYETARDQVLAEAAWGFNHTLKPLAALAEEEVFGWAYVWQYPSDCLHINRLVRNLEMTSPGDGTRWYPGLRSEELVDPANLPAVEFEVMHLGSRRVIVSREPELRADYRCRVTDVNLFSTDFRMALSYLLGHYLAPSTAGANDGMRFAESCLIKYEGFKARAAAASANQSAQRSRQSKYVVGRG